MEFIYFTKRETWNSYPLVRLQLPFTKDEYQILCSANDFTDRKGVAIILNKTAQRSLMGYNPISERLISARLRTQIGAATIIQVYAPTSSSTEEEADQFYEQLQQTIDNTPSQDILITMGDLIPK